MANEEIKKLVLDTWQAFTRGDVKTAFANLADDAVWRIPGMLPNISGTRRGKEEIIGFLRGVAKTFPQGLKSEIRTVHAEGDTVIVEMVNRGSTARGRPYENEYCFVFELAGGKIREIREYVDTQKAAAILAG